MSIWLNHKPKTGTLRRVNVETAEVRLVPRSSMPDHFVASLRLPLTLALQEGHVTPIPHSDYGLAARATQSGVHLELFSTRTEVDPLAHVTVFPPSDDDLPAEVRISFARILELSKTRPSYQLAMLSGMIPEIIDLHHALAWCWLEIAGHCPAHNSTSRPGRDS